MNENVHMHAFGNDHRDGIAERNANMRGPLAKKKRENNSWYF